MYFEFNELGNALNKFLLHALNPQRNPDGALYHMAVGKGPGPNPHA